MDSFLHVFLTGFSEGFQALPVGSQGMSSHQLSSRKEKAWHSQAEAYCGILPFGPLWRGGVNYHSPAKLKKIYTPAKTNMAMEKSAYFNETKYS